MWHPFNCLWVENLSILQVSGLQVVCRQLGFPSAGTVPYYGHTLYDQDASFIVLYFVDCRQLRPYITDCANHGFFLRTHRYHPPVYVSCQGENTFHYQINTQLTLSACHSHPGCLVAVWHGLQELGYLADSNTSHTPFSGEQFTYCN